MRIKICPFSFFIIAVALFTSGTLRAQEKDKNIAFWNKGDAYLNEQSVSVFNVIDRALTQYQPSIVYNINRELALNCLDAMLHDTIYDKNENLFLFMSSRINKVIADLNSNKISKMKVYKLYNDGFIAKTKKVSIGFDIVRGVSGGRHLISDSDMKKIVDKCDVLFLSHNHGDHVDPYVVDLFLSSNKPVVATTGILMDRKNIKHVRGDKMIVENIELNGGENIKVKIFPGHQSELDNNIYVVTTPEKVSVAQIGDQYNKEDLLWIADINKDIKPLDILIVNCWTYNLPDLVKGFNPKIVVSGHENEMGHTIDHREAFWLTYKKMKEITAPSVIMGWGEWFKY
ncbi:MAG: MBL fold metallo-hydrolase [Bacteroidales bacterium]|nr:MBL fold metallo-hydrolase [Bacteroidales bacterium]